MNEAYKLIIPFVLLPAVFMALPLITLLGAQTTGVCIFKGPAIYGLFSSSDGVPLRGIGVEAFHSGGFGGHITDGAGRTDRLGCFTLKTSFVEYFTYTYNGTSYIDQAQPGVILRDNVP